MTIALYWVSNFCVALAVTKLILGRDKDRAVREATLLIVLAMWLKGI
jgi:hypothetical protein